MASATCASRARACAGFLTLLISGALGAALGGCDGDEPSAIPDAAAPDAAVDAVLTDVAVDAAPDAAVDVGPDPDAEAPADMAAGDADAGPVECDPPLAIVPDEAFTAAYDLVVLEPTGGTGNYRFELVENNSDGIVNALTGAYLAGATENVVDRVRLTDAQCVGEAFASIYITDPLEIRPQVVAVASGDTLQLDAFGGSGGAIYSLVINNSLASVTDDGLYTAGPRLGRDVVKVLDPGTGLEDEAVISVVDDPTLSADPPRIFLPVGSQMPVSFQGGSGFFDVSRIGTSATYDAATRTFSGNQPGRTNFTFVDQYTPQRIEIAVDVAAPLQAPLGRSGRGLNQATVHGPGDLNGDGYADAIVGHPEPSIESFSDGAVFVYHGGPQGLVPQPVQIINGRARDEQYGRALTTADVDGDGRVDLIVGSANDDSAGADRGAVHIYLGQPDGLFSPVPDQALVGVRNGDRFGTAVAACDFNGDRLIDLAIGAQDFEDNGSDLAANNQGGVLVFLGSEAGYTPTADGGILVGGQLTEAGDWVGAANLRFGQALAAGDIDGDGLCDLAVGAPSRGTNGGAIYVHRGRTPDPRSEYLGGLERVPARAYIGADNSNLGRRLAIADVDNDRRGDIIAGQHADDGAGRDAGAVRIFGGGPLAGAVRQYTGDGQADWQWLGEVAGDNRGIAVEVGRWTADAIPDLIIGTWNDEDAGEDAPANVGSVIVIPGRAGGWPEAEPAFAVYGETPGALFGEALAMLGDVDGDGQPDLAVTAARDQSLGINVGRPFFVSGLTGRQRALDLPGAPAGAQNGWAIAAVGDVDRDGLSDLIVGAPETPLLPDQLRAGAAYLYRGVDGGYDSEPAATFAGHFDHNAGDRFGFGATEGDFDGDGLPDIFLSAIEEERVANLDPALFAVDGDCPARAGAQGAVYIWRGRQGPVNPERPDYVYWGPQANANMWQLLTADINGDGRDDLIVGGNGWDIGGSDRGGIQVIYGRAPDPDGRIRALCNVGYQWAGRVNGANTGRSLTLMGDLDFDGCDDIAFGAFNENIDRSPQEDDETPQGGAVRVLFGWNQDGCAPRPRMLTFAGEGNRPQAGFAIAAGNVIGGAEVDLVVGAVNHVDGDNVRTGAVYVVDGAFIEALPPEDPDRLQPTFHPLGDEATRTVIYGRENGEQFGRSLRIVGGRIIIGRAFAPSGDALRVAGADIYGFGALGLPRRIAAIGGETFKPEGRVGEIVVHDRSRPLVAVGGFQASGLATDAGAVYVYNLSGLR